MTRTINVLVRLEAVHGNLFKNTTKAKTSNKIIKSVKAFKYVLFNVIIKKDNFWEAINGQNKD
jgi:hypothetical protein